jgi:hypothetical protein
MMRSGDDALRPALKGAGYLSEAPSRALVIGVLVVIVPVHIGGNTPLVS